MSTKESLIGQSSGDLASDRNVGKEHEFLDELVGLFANESGRVLGVALLIEAERDLDVVNAKGAVVEATLAKMASQRLR